MNDLSMEFTAVAKAESIVPMSILEKAGSGVMLAWFPLPEMAKQIAEPGGELPEELHVTIAYFGKDLTSDQVATIAATARQIAAETPALSGQLAGFGRFPASESSDGKDVIVRLVDVPLLESLREKILNALDAQGIIPLRNHGFTPHMTLAYVDPSSRMIPDGDSIDITVDVITLAVGGERIDLPMKAEDLTPLTSGIPETWQIPKAVALNATKALDTPTDVAPLVQQLSKGDPISTATLIQIREVLEKADGETILGGSAVSQWLKRIEKRFDLAKAASVNDLAMEAAGSFDIPFVVEKVEEDQRLVFGWASVTSIKGEPLVDRHGDIIADQDLENAAYDFVLNHNSAGEMHDKMDVADLVESIVFSEDKQKALSIDLGKTGWWTGWKVTDDDVWKKVKSGKYPMFSIGGRAARVPLNERNKA